MRSLEIKEIEIVNGSGPSCDTLATVTAATIAADGAAVGIVAGAAVGGPAGAAAGALIGVLGALVGAIVGANMKDACQSKPGSNNEPGQGGDSAPERH